MIIRHLFCAWKRT